MIKLLCILQQAVLDSRLYGLQATAALQSCGGNAERAGDWLFSHMDDLDSAVASVLSAQSAAPASSTGKLFCEH